jgi:hypothetical protein
MKPSTKKPRSTSLTSANRAWRVFCLLGNGRVSGSCGHTHPTLTNAMRCTYEPVAYLRDPEAELRARQVKAAR